MGKRKSEAFLLGTLCALLLGCFQKHKSESMEKMLSRFENGWISKTSYQGDSTIGTFPIHVKDLKFSANEPVYKKDSLEYCHRKYDISFESGDSPQLEIEVCWNGQTRVEWSESKQKSEFDDGDENRLAPVFESAFQNAEKKWRAEAIHVTLPEIAAVASECDRFGFVYMNPKMPCNGQTGIMPIWFIRNEENGKLVRSLKSRYGKTKAKGSDCSAEPKGIHIPDDAREKGAKFSVYTDTTGTNHADSGSKFRRVEFSKEETDFNLRLIFRSENGNGC